MKKLTIILVSILLAVVITNCKKEDTGDDTPELRIFGEPGSHDIQTFTPNNDPYTSVYYPSDIATMSDKSPVVFLISGWSTTRTSARYETIMRFIVSHGYTAIFTNQGAVTNAQYSIDRFDALLDNQEQAYIQNIKPYLDFTRVGFIGHSAGGGITLTDLKYYAQPNKNFGTNGRFVMQLDPWYAFDMTENDIQTLPDNVNLILLKFGEGGNNDADGTDARIPLTIYSLLSSIPDKQKDYQIYDKESADHHYPEGDRDYSQMQGILNPLDALMEYTFKNHVEQVRQIALENGSDHPYDEGLQVVFPSADYPYPCDGAATIIDYCDIIP